MKLTQEQIEAINKECPSCQNKLVLKPIGRNMTEKLGVLIHVSNDYKSVCLKCNYESNTITTK